MAATPEPAPSGTTDDAAALRAALRRGLTAALKARDSAAMTALRTAIAAIDNAEAVPVAAQAAPTSSGHFAGARSGPGSTEAPRRQLGPGEVRGILRDQVAEQTREAGRYEALGRADAADHLRRQARALAAYL